MIYAGGNRGRDLAIGPEVHYQLGPMVLIAKYFRDTLVQNRPCGNAFWIEFAVPLSRPHPKLQAQRHESVELKGCKEPWSVATDSSRNARVNRVYATLRYTLP